VVTGSPPTVECHPLTGWHWAALDRVRVVGRIEHHQVPIAIRLQRLSAAMQLCAYTCRKSLRAPWMRREVSSLREALTKTDKTTLVLGQ
jgi:hypothetical protein